MMDREFDLINEPWIKVMKPDKSVHEVSLRSVFADAHKYTGLAGETRSQDFALLRLLLAVMYTVFSRYDENGDDIDQTDDDYEPIDTWRNIWSAGKIPMAPVDKYFDKWHDRFWLFDEKYPFYQSNAVKNNRMEKNGKPNPYGTKKLIGSLSQSENKRRLFSDREDEGIVLEYSEAARWLINLHCYDDTSIGPKDKILGPKKTWCSIIGGIFLSGNNLFETMMLNFVANADSNCDTVGAEPSWEKDNNHKHSILIPIPNNQPELLSLQTRGAYLLRNENKVIGVFLSGGYYFEENDVFIEQMTLWQPKKSKEMHIFQPKMHDMSQAAWREFGSIAAFPDLNKKNDSSSEKRTPGIILWYQYLIKKKIISSNSRIHITTVCFANKGDSSYLITDYSSDELSFHSLLLEELGARWRNCVNDEIEKCEECAKAVYTLSINLQTAAGASGDKLSGSNAKMQFYDRIDSTFRQWLESIDPDHDEIEDKSSELENTLYMIAARLGNELASQNGSGTIFGRFIKHDKKDNGKTVYSSAKAMNTYMGTIRMTLTKAGVNNGQS